MERKGPARLGAEAEEAASRAVAQSAVAVRVQAMRAAVVEVIKVVEVVVRTAGGAVVLLAVGAVEAVEQEEVTVEAETVWVPLEVALMVVGREETEGEVKGAWKVAEVLGGVEKAGVPSEVAVTVADAEEVAEVGGG